MEKQVLLEVCICRPKYPAELVDKLYLNVKEHYRVEGTEIPEIVGNAVADFTRSLVQYLINE